MSAEWILMSSKNILRMPKKGAMYLADIPRISGEVSRDSVAGIACRESLCLLGLIKRIEQVRTWVGILLEILQIFCFSRKAPPVSLKRI